MIWRAAGILCALLTATPGWSIEVVIYTGPKGSVAHREIAPRIVEAIRPVTERYGHAIRLQETAGTAETMRRCSEARDHVCLGIALVGVPFDIEGSPRPDILRSDLDLACLEATARPGNFGSLGEALRNPRTSFFVPPGSDAEGFLRAALGEAAIIVANRWPSDRMDAAARANGIVFDYGYPDPSRGTSAQLCAGEWDPVQWSEGEAYLPGFHREGSVLRCDDGRRTATLCAPTMIVMSRPEQLTEIGLSRPETLTIQDDMREMRTEIDWTLAADFSREDGETIFARSEEIWLDTACAALNGALDSIGDGLKATSTVGEVLRQLGVKAVAHASGRWIVTAGGAYVANTIGLVGASVALVTGPAVIAAGTTVTLVGIGVSVVCALDRDG